MRNWINLFEDNTSPADQLLAWAKAHVPAGVNFEGCVENEETFGIQWIERTTAAAGTPRAFLSQLCATADQLECWIRLGVQIPDDDEDDARNHYDLIRYYSGLGFAIVDDWDDEFVNMERTPESFN